MNRAAVLAIGVVAAVLVVTLVGLLIAVRSGPPAIAVEGPTAPPRAGSDVATPAAAPPLRTPDDAAEPAPPPVGTAEDKDRAPARTERAQLISALLDSGPASESWSGQATKLLEQISKRATGMTPEGCYIAGCAATFVFASIAEYEKAIAASMNLPEYHSWTGGKRWTTPEQAPDGRVLVALLLYRPD
jgi:hypothetical protein